MAVIISPYSKPDVVPTVRAATGAPERPLVPVGRAPAHHRDQAVPNLWALAIGLSELSFELSAVTSLVNGPAHQRITDAIHHIDDLLADLRTLIPGTTDPTTASANDGAERPLPRSGPRGPQGARAADPGV